jgi:ribA/ribD-fused uncharacterized protein
MSSDIYFYSVKGKYGFMSNFYKCSFQDCQGNQYCCSEQYFMAQKCKEFEPENTEMFQQILNETSATKIKQLGRKIQNYDPARWNAIRYNVMVDALRLKFAQNDNLKEALLDTHLCILYEAAKNDRIWGIGFDSKNLPEDHSLFGENLLGKALMQVRDEYYYR